ncbi:hypothetical protein INT43_002267 [Umbelopsis isabellina]|uniref:Uncharacterized protein n=1 Tax=Mortierella isabellina TaxID=91625 RepID=A0A8H7Q5B6_MORIS|nr:hypothetical protein INT43_002267 [Umbelopsis isabellina]
MPGNDAGVTPSEVYERSSKALESLSKVWNVSASVIKAITEVTDSSLRSEPDYQAVQHVKREHDQAVANLKTEFEWLEQHIPSLSDTDDSASDEKQMRIDALQQEQEELRVQSAKLTSRVKQLLEQSYALQHHLGLLIASSEDLSAN